jgi:uncharacterized surface protein with fasciclin (FAS1) repeats
MFALAFAALSAVSNAQTIFSYVENEPSLSSLFNLLGSDAQYNPVIALLQDPSQNLTLFAPTNSAFEKQLPATVDLNLVLYHAVDSVIMSTDLAPLNFVASLSNATLQVAAGADVTIIFGIPGNMNTTATVTTADQLQQNGVVHLIDTVLDPPKNVSSVATNSGVLNGLVDSLVITSLVDTVDTLPTTTIFAPVDPAMVSVENLTVSGLATTLTYHVLPATVFSTQVTEGSFQTVSGDDITITSSDGNFYVNNAQIVATDILTATGVVHLVDAVLNMPTSPTRTIQQNLAIDTSMTTLSGLLDSNPDIAAVVNTAGTFFAPNNDAFEALGPIDDPTLLTAALTYHVAGVYAPSANLTALQIVPSLLNDPAYVNLGGDFQKLVVAAGDTVTVNDATVVVADLFSANTTVAHVIDTVLIPPPDVVAVAENAGLTTLIDAVVAAGLAETVVGPSLTIFAPTNDGFANFLQEGNISNVNVTILAETLAGHVVPAVAFSTDLSNGMNVSTLGGATWTITIEENGDVYIDNAKVLTANVLTAGGVVHVIDRVIGGPGPSTGSDSLSTGAIVGIIAGVLVVAGLGYYCFNKQDDVGAEGTGFNQGQTSYTNVDGV